MDLEAVLRHEAFAALRAVKLGRAVGSDVQLQPPLRGTGPLADVTSVPASILGVPLVTLHIQLGLELDVTHSKHTKSRITS